MLVRADARRIPLADDCVQCVVTSPPYWGLRKYVGEQELVWGGEESCEHDFSQPTPPRRSRSEADAGSEKQKSNTGSYYGSEGGNICQKCDTWRGAYGLEPLADCLAWARDPIKLCNRCYVCHTVLILRECRRVLREDGVLFLNLGDSYQAGRSGYGEWTGPKAQACDGEQKKAGMTRSHSAQADLKPKDLCLIPQRVALAAQRDGWWVRSDIIWSKPNPMPESVRDRPTDAYEHILMLTRSARYFWDAEAVAEELLRPDEATRRTPARFGGALKFLLTCEQSRLHSGNEYRGTPSGKRNLRNVWHFATQPYAGAHFATFPEELPWRCILAATSAKGCCPQCGGPWVRVVVHESLTTGWRPGCECRGQHGRTVPCLVLDHFAGSGTTGKVALELGRRFIGLDLAYDPKQEKNYAALARNRMSSIQPKLVSV